ncbi:MAG: GxxExxY protein [Sphingobacteriales bacterium]|nr:GxxExxY protein [Sphingobacteriales bacterium]
MIKEQYKYSELTSKIIGCAITVHKMLGNGFQEVIYQRALAIELALAGVGFSREHEMPIFYREEQIGTRRVDFLVEGVISVELKAITKLEDVHFAQAINYLEAYNLEIGLLINFGETSLNFKKTYQQEIQTTNHSTTKIKQIIVQTNDIHRHIRKRFSIVHCQLFGK